MADVKAIKILDRNIKKFKDLRAPPEDDDKFESYKDNLEKLIKVAVSEVTQISDYAEKILQRLLELRERIPEEIRRIKEVVEKKVQQLTIEVQQQTKVPRPGFEPGASGMVDQSVTKCPERPMSGDCVPGRYLQQLLSIQNIATNTKHLMDSRLAELISETERLLAKIKDGVSLTMEDMEFLKGCTDAWVDSKGKSFEDEKHDKERESREKTKQLEKEKRMEKERRFAQEKADQEARRRDPNNWKTFIYKDKVDDRKSPSHGMQAAVSFADNEMYEEDIQCLASDDFDGYKAVLGKEEKAVSRIISINSKKGNLGTEIPVRVFIPHVTLDNKAEEVVIKHSINGGKWVTTEVLQATENVQQSCGSYDVTLAGVELRDVASCRLVAVTRPAIQTVKVNKQEALIGSDVDSSVKVLIEKGTFKESSSIELKVQPIRLVDRHECMLHDEQWKHVQSSTSMVSMTCASPPAGQIKVAFSDVHKLGRKSADRRVHLFQTDDSDWKLADFEYRPSTGTTLLLLPPNKMAYRVVDIGISGGMSDKDAIKVIATFQPANGTEAKLIFRQKSENPKNAILLVSESHLVDENIAQLKSSGYDFGPEPSKEVCLSEGQIITITSEGCVDLTQVDQDKLNHKFFAYMNPVILRLSIAYQKDIRALRASGKPYDGYIVVTLKSEAGEPLDTVRLGMSFESIRGSGFGGMYTERSDELNSSKAKPLTKPQPRKK